MFNKDFYPTPPNVAQMMLLELQKVKGAIALEPSAGKGDLIKALREAGAKQIEICEKEEELAKIAGSLADRFLGNDFLKLKSEDVSHIDIIFMNPPFSVQTKHIAHAIEIAPPGCQVVSLCNAESYNPYRPEMDLCKLQTEVNKNGSFTKLGKVFDNAERKTDVSVGLISYFKPKTGEDEFEGIFDLEEEYEDQDNGLMSYDVLRDMVGRYVGAVKMFDSVIEASSKITALTEPFSSASTILFGAYGKTGSNYYHITRDIYKKDLQKAAWKTIFNKMKMEKYVTKSVLETINKFVEKQTSVPFSLNNIYKMIDMIVGTHESRMNRVIVEIFDELTSHTHENRFQKEGWKTNSQYMVNQKFIINWGGVEMKTFDKWASRYDFAKMDDLNKAMCYITGTPFNHCENWERWTTNLQPATKTTRYPNTYDYPENIRGKEFTRETTEYQYREFGKWHEWGFFTVKAFKKGTLHVKFNSEDDWIAFNRTASKAKGFHLAEKFTSDFRSKETGVRVAK